MIAGLYIHRDSIIHRITAGIKMSSLFLVGAVLFFIPYWWLQLCVVAVVLILWHLSRISFAQLLQMGWIVPCFIVSTILLNGYLTSWEQGVVMGSRMLALILLSMLVTYTTRLEEMTAFVVKIMTPIKFIGGNPALVGLAISFSLRFIPMVAMILSDIREAQQARGKRINVIFLAPVLIIRLLKVSSEIAESLEARGFNSRLWKTD